MPRTMPPSLVGVLAGAVVAMAGVGAYLQASMGGPGTTAFDVRLLLVSVAFVGALILGLAVRIQLGGGNAARPASNTGPERAR